MSPNARAASVANGNRSNSFSTRWRTSARCARSSDACGSSPVTRWMPAESSPADFVSRLSGYGCGVMSVYATRRLAWNGKVMVGPPSEDALLIAMRRQGRPSEPGLLVSWRWNDEHSLVVADCGSCWAARGWAHHDTWSIECSPDSKPRSIATGGGYARVCLRKYDADSGWLRDGIGG